MTAALIAAIALAPVNAASAAPLCALDSASRTLTVTVQAGGNVRLGASPPYLVVNGSACALLNDVNAVTVDMAPSPNASLDFDLRSGLLGPGFTDEGNGSSEIEFQVGGMTTATVLNVFGSDGSDGVRVGQYLDRITGISRGQVNLNVLADGATPDVDVSFTTFPGRVSMNGADGNDLLSGSGAGVLLTGPYGASMSLQDGWGVDQVAGGSGSDLIVTNPNLPDHGDTFSGGAGTDTFLTGGGGQEHSAIRLDGLPNDGLLCPGADCVGNNIAGDFEVIDGSPANELIIGDADAETITGGGGYDIIKGLGGDDTIRNESFRPTGMPNVLYGGAGNDLLYATRGSADTFHGGGGSDTLSFVALASGAVVTLDDLPNDGTPGMDADVADDIERIIGTGYADTITGNAADNTILGGPGPDTLSGLGGNDTLLGQGGNDNVNGGGGTDTCAQGGGTGTITGCEA